MVSASSITPKQVASPLKPQFKRLLLWIALISAGLQLIPIVLLGVMFLLRDVILIPPSILLYIPFMYLMMLFTSPIRYLVITGVVLALIIAALIWARPGRWAAIWLLAGIAAIVAYVVVLPGDYQPAVVARPELKMVVATAPNNLVERVTRQAQVAAEGRPCIYELLGWATDGRFYYAAYCGADANWDALPRNGPVSRVSTVWSIDPASETRPTQVSAVTSSLYRSAIQDRDALAYMDSPNVEPEEVRAMTASMYLKVALISEDGRWIAALTEHLYGPQDVVLVEIAD